MPTIAFFGATGGCTLAALSRSLEAGNHARALARTPSKLQDMLKGRGISQELLDTKLVIIQGNAKDPEAAQKVLVDDNGQIVDQIVYGIGGKPKFTPRPWAPTLDDPTVCQDSISSINTALRTIKASGQTKQMPLISAISTTGMSQSRDIPLMMVPLYHWMLAVPHADKKVLEDRIVEAKEKQLIRDFVIVKASLLTDGKAHGKTKIRVGWEGKAPGTLGDGAAVGYTVSREDVGWFLHESVIANGDGELLGKKVSITY
ncbi:MAG: hypothetical protein Q9170_006412 [Blastenia crenularia]